jgi:lipopolysaccharide/colanic/teichoic acid biosynthesis glycosyltransferase
VTVCSNDLIYLSTSYRRKSMNNSEMSVVATPQDTLTATQAYAYPGSWKDSTDGHLQGVPTFGNGHSGDKVTVLQASSTGIHEVVGAQQAELPPESKSKHNDVGFWLLHDPATRHNQWERILGAPQSASEVLVPGLRYASFIKRVFDFIGSLFLLAALLPLFGLIAILIKLDSPGPVFFRHYRVGRNGKQFMLWKFRSMRADVPKYEASPRSSGDMRLTRVGRLIRRLSVDEIPQLINVLKGEMSLVGPRPEMPFIVAHYHPICCERLFVRPGITGLWQISPARAYPIHDNLQYDLHYVRNQNVILDCVILLRTITAIVRGIGAV